jgi:hypothetical protein
MNPFDTYADQLDRLKAQIDQSCDLALKTLSTMDLRSGPHLPGMETPAAEEPEADDVPVPDLTEAGGRLDEQATHALAMRLEADEKSSGLTDRDLPKKPKGLELHDGE